MKNIRQNIDKNLKDVPAMKDCFYDVHSSIPNEMNDLYPFFGDTYIDMHEVARRILPVYAIIRERLK